MDNDAPQSLIKISMSVNDARVDAHVEPRQHLGDFLRQNLGLTGTHIGCEHGVCGACSVVMDGVVVRSCLTLAVQANNRTVRTIEAQESAPDPVATLLQESFVEHNALQCGFCTPAIILTATEYIHAGGQASREEVRAYLSGNYCRCTGYHAIVDAICSTIAKLPQNQGSATK